MTPAYADRSGAAEVCWGCGALRPIEEFEEVFEPGSKPQGFEIRCRACRANPERGLSPLPEEPDPESGLDWTRVSPHHREMLLKIVNGVPETRAIEEAGYKPGYRLKRILSRNVATRKAYQEMLRLGGMDMLWLAGKLRALACARKPMWNQAMQRWDWFPDNTTQLRAVELAHKALDLMPKNKPEGPPAPTVVFVTNLDTPAREVDTTRFVVERPKPTPLRIAPPKTDTTP